jgi:hypothetical protein
MGAHLGGKQTNTSVAAVFSSKSDKIQASGLSETLSETPARKGAIGDLRIRSARGPLADLVARKTQNALRAPVHHCLCGHDPKVTLTEM